MHGLGVVRGHGIARGPRVGAQPQPVAVGLIFHTEEVVVCEIGVVRGVLDDEPDLVDLLLGDLMDVFGAQPVLGTHAPKAVLVGAPGLSPGDRCVFLVPLDDRPAPVGHIHLAVHHEMVEPFWLNDVDTAAAATGDLAAVLGPAWGREQRWLLNPTQ